MERFDRLGPDRSRERSFRGRVLDRSPDEILQQLVTEAARVTAAPIATVSLLLHNIQFFRAHVGLPADLQDTQATDRCISFCQVVAAEGTAICVEDAERDDRIPRTLVRTHGVRAYLGLPVSLDDRVVGTLCVIDVQPRGFSAAQRAALEALANSVSTRLGELQETATETRVISGVKDDVLRGCITELDGVIVMARVSAVELESRMRAIEQTLGDRDAAIVEILADAARAAGELSETLRSMQETARRAVGVVQAVDRVELATHRATLGDALHLAATVAGGLSLRIDDHSPQGLVERHVAIAVLSTILAAIVRAGWPLDEPIAVTSSEVDGEIEVRLRASASAAAAGHAALEASGVAVTAWVTGAELVVRLARLAS